MAMSAGTTYRGVADETHGGGQPLIMPDRDASPSRSARPVPSFCHQVPPRRGGPPASSARGHAPHSKPKSPQTTGQDGCRGLRSTPVDVALVFLSQSGPNPIMPESSEFLWGMVSVALFLVPVVVAVLAVRYLIQTRRAAESAALEAAALREEFLQRRS
jgi:hypothetical protein